MSTTLSSPDFRDARWISRLALRTDDPDRLVAHLVAQGFVSAARAPDARHHLQDTTHDIHILVYPSGVTTWIAPSWDVLGPVIYRTLLKLNDGGAGNDTRRQAINESFEMICKAVAR